MDCGLQCSLRWGWCITWSRTHLLWLKVCRVPEREYSCKRCVVHVFLCCPMNCLPLVIDAYNLLKCLYSWWNLLFLGCASRSVVLNLFVSKAQNISFILQIFLEHFRETLNQPEPKSTFVLTPGISPQNCKWKHTLDEVEQALKKMKSSKAAGQD